jgi:hypothetical protein
MRRIGEDACSRARTGGMFIATEINSIAMTKKRTTKALLASHG